MPQRPARCAAVYQPLRAAGGPGDKLRSDDFGICAKSPARAIGHGGLLLLPAWCCAAAPTDSDDCEDLADDTITDASEGGPASSPRVVSAPSSRRRTCVAIPQRRVPCMALLALACAAIIWPAAKPFTRLSIQREVGLALRVNWGCGIEDDNTDYVTRHQDVSNMPNVGAPGDCALACLRDSRCMAWTWGKIGIPVVDRVCYLKALEQGELPQMKANPSVVSGSLPCNPGALQPPGSLFCFVLMLPDGYEVNLVKMQAEQKLSIFGCEEYTVFSNKAINLAPGVVASVVNSDLRCDVGGEFKTALNLNIFLAVWKQVIAENHFRNHDWTVKVDPDTVFFAERLRPLLAHHSPDIPKGVYLNNCKFGLHGPLEVFSKNAVLAWSAGTETCLAHFDQVCSGPCNWGEDMFIDQCLKKVLGVRRDSDWGLLSEEHCKPDSYHQNEWIECTNGNVAFHPFKTEVDYQACLQKTGVPLPSVVPVPAPAPAPTTAETSDAAMATT
mmetsp:Transcript_69308/g.200802  ORF Transcript_69308/g.200802 Transcript_69308/m.200802 type:complete len:499 (-) Transcript_69308:93-1589(-)